MSKITDLQWQEVDVQAIIARIAEIEAQIRHARDGNQALHAIGLRIEDQRKLVRKAEVAVNDSRVEYQLAQSQIVENEKKLARLEREMADPSKLPLPPAQQQGLEERFRDVSDRVDLDNLDRLSHAVSSRIGSELTEINREIQFNERAVEECFARFVATWKMEAADLQAKIEAAPDFFARLTRLEIDGLPAHEQRFFDLLQNQSHQNLAALSTHMQTTRKEIHARMELVNESLKQVPFNQSHGATSYLRIETSDRQLAEVREFKQEIQEAQSHRLSADKEKAESRFVLLRRLVERLGSQDPVHLRWRNAVLDVRQHVEFVGIESGESGVEIERHRSGAGRSGGQRQKLATTCLAAALRYQLGGSDYGVPRYAAVILDEAFDKADNEFTALAMQIFANFGFQMIVATPLKSVMTLEPFIGGACFIDIKDRNTSTLLRIEYDEQRHRLQLPATVHGVLGDGA